MPALAGHFRKARCRTAAFVSHNRASANYGFARGFDLYRYQQRDFRSASSTAEDIVGRAIDFLEETKDEDVFLLIHIFDTHTYYRITDYILNEDEFADFNLGRKASEIFGDPKFLLRNAIMNADVSFGRLTEYLRRKHWYDESAVIVSADHGTMFKKRACGHHLYDESIRIPLIVKYPASRAAGRKAIEPPVEATNAFLVTLLDMNGIPFENESDGVSFAAMAQAAENKTAVPKDYAISEDVYVGFHSVACRTASDKLIVSRLEPEADRSKWGGRGEGRRIEYYDLKKDPEEMKDASLEPGSGERVAYLTGKIEGFLKQRRLRF